MEYGGKMVTDVEFKDEKGYMSKAKAILLSVGNLRLVGEN